LKRALLLAICLQELEAMLEDERRAAEEARQAAVIVERKRIALQAELDELRSILETVRHRFIS
jgi:hypothetical protein